LFKKITLQLENGKTFVINASANSADNRYVQSTSLNGKQYTRNWISYEDILKGGVFESTMGSKPNTVRGTGEKDFPYSFSTGK